MSSSATAVEWGEGKRFDVAAIGNWVEQHIGVCLVVALVIFIFFLFQKGGFAEKLLEYRIRGRELDAKKADATREIIRNLNRRYEGDEPLLPFD